MNEGIGPGRTFFITTLGCKVNQCESEGLARYLEERGWRRAPEGGPADLCVVNTCTVTHRAAQQSRQTTRQVARSHPQAAIVVTGCHAQVEPAELAGIDGVSLLVGHGDKHRIGDLADGLSGRTTGPSRVIHGDIRQVRDFRPMPAPGFGGRSRPFLKIQDGCDAFCAYCIVPYTRGPGRSLGPDAVLDQIRRLSREGYREVVLTGIHVGRYGLDFTPAVPLAALLRRVEAETGMERIRISSIEPHELGNDILDLMAGSGRFCRHVHVPLQSGDDDILRRMGRPYDGAFFRDRVAEIRRRLPEAAIGTDVLVGFPGETEAAFTHTLDLLATSAVDYFHVFPFSPRPGTPAAVMPDPVPPEILKERTRRLRALGLEKRRAFQESNQGREVTVLVESPDAPATGEFTRLKGVSDNYLEVVFDGPPSLAGELVSVTITGVAGPNLAEGRWRKA